MVYVNDVCVLGNGFINVLNGFCVVVVECFVNY